MREDPLSQDVLDVINANLARALDAGDRPENQPVFAVHRDIFPSSRMVDHRVDGAVHVSVHNAASGRRLALGALVSARRVGRFDVCLVHAHDASSQEDAWRIVAGRPHGEVLPLSQHHAERFWAASGGYSRPPALVPHIPEDALWIPAP